MTELLEDRTVLIIEDDLILTLSLELMLKKIGFTRFVRAETGEKAISLAKKTCPDLMLVDICLGPGISGVEAVKEIQESCQAPVIYITGNSDEKNRTVAGETDYVDYLVKPITPVEVRRSVEKIWPETIGSKG
ncbi:MAG: response regulator [Balneolaceae bacterium]